MKVLYLRNTRGYHIDVIEVMENLGYKPDINRIPDEDLDLLQQLSKKDNPELLEKLMGQFAFVFSLDYYPTIANLCHQLGKIYVSWSTEPPYTNLYSASVMNPTNRIFVTDKWLAEMMTEEGIPHFWYLPEGINTARCDRVLSQQEGEPAKECSMIVDTKVPSWQECFGTDDLKDATLGYLEGMLTAQIYVHGRDLFARTFPQFLMDDLTGKSTVYKMPDSVESLQSFYAQKCIYPRVSAAEARTVLKIVSLSANVHLYSNATEENANVQNEGILKYEDRLAVIADSKVNMILAPRGYKDGVYGQILHAIAMGGYVVCDFRRALTDDREVNGVFNYYDDVEDLATKIRQGVIKYEALREKVLEGKAYVRDKFDLLNQIRFMVEKI